MGRKETDTAYNQTQKQVRRRRDLRLEQEGEGEACWEVGLAVRTIRLRMDKQRGPTG